MITLPSSPLIIPVGYRKDKKQDYPMLIVLNSVAAGKEIAISVDDGISYFVPEYNTSAATQLAVSIAASITHIRLTGTAGVDKYAIR